MKEITDFLEDNDCINRNIVECKGLIAAAGNPPEYNVLIETLWNVKICLPSPS